jgi:hypothetical protein
VQAWLRLTKARKPRVGDRGFHDGEPSEVQEVIEDGGKRRKWQVDHAGILIGNGASGRVYVEPGEVVFISRGLAD